MTGWIKIEAMDGGVTVETHYKNMSPIDRVQFLHAAFTALHIDVTNMEEVGMFVGLACMAAHSSTVISRNADLGEQLKAMLNKNHDEQEADE